MNTKMINTLLVSLLFLSACSQIKQKKEKINDLTELKVKEEKTQIDLSLLNGVWAESEDENANFRIKGDSMYFIEDYNNPVYIKVEQDTLITYYYGLITKDAILMLSTDSLVILTEVGDTIRLYNRTPSSTE